MKKVLVTGSAGMTGSEAVDFFKEKGWEVVGIDNNTRSKLLGTPLKEIENNIDITNREAITSLFGKHKFDVVIHTAGQASHEWSQNHPFEDFQINTVGTLTLLEATRLYCPEAVFVFCSSDKVYGTNMERKDLVELETRYHSDKPFAEDLSIDYSNHSPFGAAKTSADLYVQEYGYTFGMKTVCFRLGCITGRRHAGSHMHGFLANTARCIKEGDTFILHGWKGKQVRDNIHSFDLVNAMWHFIQNPKIAAVYNMGGGPDRSVSFIEAVKMMEQETGKKAKVEYIEQSYHGDRVWDIHDVSKFKKDYPDWQYKYSLQDIIKDLCS